MLLVDSPTPLSTLPINETSHLRTEDQQDGFVNVSVDDPHNRALTFSVSGTARIDTCINIGDKTTKPDIVRECENYGRLPDEYVLLPEATSTTAGIDYAAIQEFWNRFEVQYNAFTFIPKSSIDIDDDRDLISALREAPYVLVKGYLDQTLDTNHYQIAYIDDTGALAKYTCNEQERAIITNFNKDKKFICDDKTNTNEDVRNYLEKLAVKFPNHTPKTRVKYDLLDSNCSSVVREGLKQGGANIYLGTDIVKVAFSSPNGVMKASLALKKNMSAGDVSTYLNDEIARLSANDHKYRKDRDKAIPTEKLEKFIELKTRHDRGETIEMREIYAAANMHRGSSLFSPKGSSSFNFFKEAATKQKKEGRDMVDDASAASSDSPRTPRTPS